MHSWWFRIYMIVYKPLNLFKVPSWCVLSPIDETFKVMSTPSDYSCHLKGVILPYPPMHQRVIESRMIKTQSFSFFSNCLFAKFHISNYPSVFYINDVLTKNEKEVA